MKKADYKKMKKGVEQRYQEAIVRAETERTESLAAIEKVWRIAHPRRDKTTSASSKYGSLVETVRKSLEYVPQRFTKSNVLTAMQQVSPEVAKNCNSNSLAGCLHRLKAKGVIAEVAKGRGSAPTKYEVINKNTEVTE